MAFSSGFYERRAHNSQTGGIPKYTLESGIPFVRLTKKTSSFQTSSDHAKELTELWNTISQHTGENSDYIIEEGCDVVSITGFNDVCYSVTGFLQPEDGVTVSKDNLDLESRGLNHLGSASTLVENDRSAQEERDAIEGNELESDAGDEDDCDETEPICFLGNPIIPDGTVPAWVFADEIGPLVFLKGYLTLIDKRLGGAQHLIYELQIILEQGVSSVSLGRCFEGVLTECYTQLAKYRDANGSRDLINQGLEWTNNTSALIRYLSTILSKAPIPWEAFSRPNGDIVYFTERLSYPSENDRDRALATIKAIAETLEDWKELNSKLGKIETSCNALAKTVGSHPRFS
jgi:hypothetical protein